MSTYTLNFRNESSDNASFVIFQKAPDVNNQNSDYLVWKTIHTIPPPSPWHIDYSFVWGKTGTPPSNDYYVIHLKEGEEFNLDAFDKVEPIDFSESNTKELVLSEDLLLSII
ncbi:MAG: hypothetical protein AB8B56_07780 [Crocinitomicaceae bacterium]